MKCSKALCCAVAALMLCSCSRTTLPTQGNASTDLSSGLVAYYPFDGNADDSSGNGFDGVVSNAALTKNRFGDTSLAYSFDGYSSSIRCGDILDNIFCAPIAQFSVSGWARARASGSNVTGGGFIIGKNGGGSYGPYQWNVSYVDGTISAQVFFDTAASNYLTLTAPMSTSRWFHFVLVFDGSASPAQRLALYVDGQTFNVNPLQIVGVVGTTTVNSQQHLTIGATHYANMPQSPQDFFNGDLDDLRIYGRPLTQTEAQTLYLKGD